MNRTWLNAVCCLALLSACSSGGPVPAFVSLGGALDLILTQNAQTSTRSLALDAVGNPSVAWVESSAGVRKLYVKHWNGVAWQQQGGALNLSAAQDASFPALAFDSSGRTLVAWSEASSLGQRIYVKRWDGSTWRQVGDSALNVNLDSSADTPALALDSSGNPTVAWNETGKIYVKRWNGAAWQGVGSTALNVGLSASAVYPSLALDPAGNPVVSWSEFAGASHNIYVKRWDGAAWQLLGSTFLDVNTDKDAFESSLSLDSSGNPTVAWSEIDAAAVNSSVSPKFNLYVKKWNGSAWQSLGAAPLDNELSKATYGPSLALNSSENPTVAWTENGGVSSTSTVYVKSWNGSAWQQLGALWLNFDLNALSSGASLALDAAGNPTVAWSEEGNSSSNFSPNVYVKRYVP